MSLASILLISLGVVMGVTIFVLVFINLRVRKIKKESKIDYDNNEKKYSENKDKYVNDLRKLNDSNKK